MDNNQDLLNMIVSGEISEKEFFGNKSNKDKIIPGEITDEEAKMILNAYGIKDIKKE